MQAWDCGFAGTVPSYPAVWFLLTGTAGGFRVWFCNNQHSAYESHGIITEPCSLHVPIAGV